MKSARQKRAAMKSSKNNKTSDINFHVSLVDKNGIRIASYLAPVIGLVKRRATNATNIA